MTMDKSLRVRAGMTRARSVLTRDERIKRLKDAERWKEGDTPFGLPKVRVYKLAMKKKKKKAKEEGEEGGVPPLRRLRPPRPRRLPPRARSSQFAGWTSGSVPSKWMDRAVRPTAI